MSAESEFVESNGCKRLDFAWASGFYPETCRSCLVVKDAIDTVLPSINDSSLPIESRELEVEILKRHASDIRTKCIKHFLITAGYKLSDVWPKDEDCWLSGEK